MCGWRCIITVVVLYDDELARNVFPWYNIEVINIFTHFQTYKQVRLQMLVVFQETNKLIVCSDLVNFHTKI